jgi:hypothetical protein
MNKFINILILILSFPIISFSIIIGFDIPIEFLRLSGANMPYKLEIFYGMAGMIFVVGIRRSIRRWMGIRLANQIKRFQWNTNMDKNRYKQAMLYLYLEALLHFFLAYALYTITPFALPVVLVYAFLGIDHLLFAFITKSKNLFRVGLTSKALVIADRDIKIVYFKGLRKVDKHQQSIFFDYIKELQISIPSDCIEESKRAEFKEKLAGNLDRDSVFFTESFKNY